MCLRAAAAVVAAALCCAATALADDGTATTTTTTTTTVETTTAVTTTVAPPPQPPEVTSALPAWCAPGAPVLVAGRSGPGARVVLLLAGRRVASTSAGPGGRFSFRFRAPSPGRHRLTVVASGLRSSAGVLHTRDIVLDAVGDITFGEQVGPSLARDGAASPWLAVGPTLRAADVTVGNLETAVSLRGSAAVKQYRFRGPPWYLPPLRAVAGFDVLTLANNHAADYGPVALLDTIAAVRSAGIQPIGAGATATLARRPAYVEAGGLRIALLGYSDVNPPGFAASDSSPGTARAEPAAIAADVAAARRRADLVVCFFHWGEEMQPLPNARQVAFASDCRRAGAQVVLGAHPHVLGPVTETARSLVAWTLGNFLFPSSGASARTAILQVLLDRSGVRGYRLVPVHIAGFTPQLVR